MDDEILLVDPEKSLTWNYVARVDKELEQSNISQKVLLNNLIPSSYRRVIEVLYRASNFSRTTLLLDDSESYVAFAIIVDEESVPFLFEDLDDIVFPVNAFYHIFYNTRVASSDSDSALISNFIANTVIPCLNSRFNSWKKFKYCETQI